MTQSQSSPKIGICLGGGGALGYAHIGVLQALEEHGIRPEVVAGSSMGAIIGAFYANDLPPKQMLQIIRDEKMYKVSTLLNPALSKRGLSSHKTLRLLLHELVPANDFSSLKREFYVCVSNLTKARGEIVGQGKLDDYVVASSSIPYIFEAEIIDNAIYVDGGVLNNLPAQALQGKCDVIIGVDVLPFFETKTVNHLKDNLMLPLHTVVHNNSLAGRKLCDFLIEPPAVKRFHAFSFDKYEEIYKIGYEATVAYIKAHPEIRNLGRKE